MKLPSDHLGPMRQGYLRRRNAIKMNCRAGIMKRTNRQLKKTPDCLLRGANEAYYSRRLSTRKCRFDLAAKSSSSFDELLASLKRLDPATQLKLWNILIDSHVFDFRQLNSLRTALDERIKFDIVSGVPFEIALYIMSFLSPNDLCQAAQTCRSWRIVCEDNRLWREKCKEEGLLDDKQTLDALFKDRINKSHIKQEELANECLKEVPKSERQKWKIAYMKNINVLRNWKCRNFEISEPLSSSGDTKSLSISCQESEGMTKQEELDAIIDLRCGGSPSHSNGNSSWSAGNPITGTRVEKSFTTAHLMQLPCHGTSVITCLQFNPKTNTIVSGSDDHTLKVWSSETGRCINTLRGHFGGVWSSQLSPEDIVVSGSTDRTLRVWKAHTGELLHTLNGHVSTVRCLALNGDFVVSGSRDKTLRVWNIVKGTCEHILAGHLDAVRCVEYKNDIIVSGAYDHTVMVWNAKDGNFIWQLECHFSRIYSLQFDGKTIASGSLDSTICIWDVSTGQLRHQLEGHKSLTSKMQMKGNLLVSANADSFCKVWDISTGKCLQTLGGKSKHTSAITSVYFNDKHVVTSGDDGTVKLWDIKTGEFIRNLIVLPAASSGGVVWRIRASYSKLVCAVGSRLPPKDTQLLVLDFNE